MKGIKMDIKKRLIIYNNLTIIVPFIVTAVVALIFIFAVSYTHLTLPTIA